MKKKAGCYEWWDKPKKPEKYFNWWEKKEKNGLLHKEGYIPVKCPSTKREYHVPFNPETDNIKDLKCPLCGRKIYRKKKKGRPAIYSEVEQEILNKCKHKKVQSILKTSFETGTIFSSKKSTQYYFGGVSIGVF